MLVERRLSMLVESRKGTGAVLVGQAIKSSVHEEERGAAGHTGRAVDKHVMLLLNDELMQKAGSRKHILAVLLNCGIVDCGIVIDLDASTSSTAHLSVRVDVVLTVVSDALNVEDGRRARSSDTLIINLVDWIRAERDPSVANAFVEEWVQEITVGLENAAIDAVASIGVKPEAGASSAELTAIRVGILKIDQALGVTLPDLLTSHPVASDESVAHLSVASSLELSRVGALFVRELNGNLPRAHHLAVLGIHPFKFSRHSMHHHVASVDTRAIKQQLVVVVLRRVVHHERHRELLPDLVEDADLGRWRSGVFALHIVEELGWAIVQAAIPHVRQDLEVGDAIDTTLPTNDFVILNNGVLVVEEVLRSNERLLADPDVALSPSQHLPEGTNLLPLVKMRDVSEDNDGLTKVNFSVNLKGDLVTRGRENSRMGLTL